MPDGTSDQDCKVPVLYLAAMDDQHVQRVLSPDVHDLLLMMRAARNGEEQPKLNQPLRYPHLTLRLAASLFGAVEGAEKILSTTKKGDPITMESLQTILSQREQAHFLAVGETKAYNVIGQVMKYLRKENGESELLEQADPVSYMLEVFHSELEKPNTDKSQS